MGFDYEAFHITAHVIRVPFCFPDWLLKNPVLGVTRHTSLPDDDDDMFGSNVTYEIKLSDQTDQTITLFVQRDTTIQMSSSTKGRNIVDDMVATFQAVLKWRNEHPGKADFAMYFIDECKSHMYGDEPEKKKSRVDFEADFTSDPSEILDEIWDIFESDEFTRDSEGAKIVSERVLLEVSDVFLGIEKEIKEYLETDSFDFSSKTVQMCLFEHCELFVFSGIY